MTVESLVDRIEELLIALVFWPQKQVARKHWLIRLVAMPPFLVWMLLWFPFIVGFAFLVALPALLWEMMSEED